MNKIPSYLKPENKEKFHEYKQKSDICVFRKEIIKRVLGGDENDYFDTEEFQNKYNITPESMECIVKVVRNELEENGWKTKLSFGDTGLFIYSSEEDPKKCW